MFSDDLDIISCVDDAVNNDSSGAQSETGKSLKSSMLKVAILAILCVARFVEPRFVFYLFIYSFIFIFSFSAETDEIFLEDKTGTTAIEFWTIYDFAIRHGKKSLIGKFSTNNYTETKSI